MTETTEQPLAGDDTLAIMSSADAASDMIGIENFAEPDVVQEAIERFLAGLEDGTVTNTLGPQEGPIALGSLWGNAVMMEYDWDWIHVHHGDWNGLGLVDKERRYLALPHQMFLKLLSADCDPSMAGPGVRFKAIGAGKLPEAESQSFTIITD